MQKKLKRNQRRKMIFPSHDLYIKGGVRGPVGRNQTETLWLMASINGMFWLAKTQRTQHICRVDKHAPSQPLVTQSKRLPAVSEAEPRTVRERTTHGVPLWTNHSEILNFSPTMKFNFGGISASLILWPRTWWLWSLFSNCMQGRKWNTSIYWLAPFALQCARCFHTHCLI